MDKATIGTVCILPEKVKYLYKVKKEFVMIIIQKRLGLMDLCVSIRQEKYNFAIVAYGLLKKNELIDRKVITFQTG